MYCIHLYTVYINVYKKYLIMMHYKCEKLTSYIFGTVHSDRTGSFATQHFLF